MKTEYDDEIQIACRQHLSDWNYDWRLYKAQLWQESRHDPDAISPAGARGIAQFMPDTWAQWSRKTGYAGESPHEPIPAIQTGAAYMNHLLHQWYWQRPELDRIALALASYNAGLGHILDAQEKANYAHGYADIIERLVDITGEDDAPETIDYVHKIFRYWLKAVEKG